MKGSSPYPEAQSAQEHRGRDLPAGRGPFPAAIATCIACRTETAAPLSIWGYPICRQCAARLRLGPQEPGPGSARELEHVPPFVDDLDIHLALMIAQSMLEND
jgi:hypothetical protein